jgi:hypothetical protein
MVDDDDDDEYIDGEDFDADQLLRHECGDPLTHGVADAPDIFDEIEAMGLVDPSLNDLTVESFLNNPEMVDFILNDSNREQAEELAAREEEAESQQEEPTVAIHDEDPRVSHRFNNASNSLCTFFTLI